MCSAEITLTDKNTGEVITLGDMDLNISSTLMGITFTNENLALNRRYGFSLNASNINGSVISSGDISKLKPSLSAGSMTVHIRTYAGLDVYYMKSCLDRLDFLEGLAKKIMVTLGGGGRVA